MTVIVDRIEGDLLVVELPDGGMHNLPRAFAPDAREGDLIKIFVDRDKTDARKREIEGRMRRLFKD